MWEFFRQTIGISGMNYQQRNRALFECIREPCGRTGGSPNMVYVHGADFTPFQMLGF